MTNQLKVYSWSVAGAILITAMFLVVYLYSVSFNYLFSYWNNLSEGEYAHGYLVIAISLFLVWRNRVQLQQVSPCPSLLALFPLMASCLLWFAALVINVSAAQPIALLGIVISSVWLVCGTQVMRFLAFPLGFIIFAIPVWFPVSPFLQDLTADTVFWIIRLLRIPAFMEENTIIVPAGVLSVEEACSGLRYFLAALTLGSLYAYMNYVSFIGRAAVILLSAITALLANIIRVFIIVYLGYSTEMQHPWVHDHLMLGWYIFAALVVVLLVIDNHYYSASGEVAKPAIQQRACSKSLLLSCLVVLFSVSTLIAGPMVLQQRNSQQVDADRYQLILPAAVSPWRVATQSGKEWQPSYHGSVSSQQDYLQPGTAVPVSLYMAYYPVQKQGEELINDLNSVYNPDIWDKVYTRPRLHQSDSQPVLEQQVKSKAGDRLVWYWYNVDGKISVSSYLTKLLQLRSVVLSSEQGFVTVISVPAGDLVHSRQLLQQFMLDMQSGLQKLEIRQARSQQTGSQNKTREEQE